MTYQDLPAHRESRAGSTSGRADRGTDQDFDLSESLQAAASAGGLGPVNAEFLNLYSEMRRRPDGRSLGPLHDVIWQSAALVLGQRPWSEAEYTAVLGQLARSARHLKIGTTSRNYIEYVRREMEDGE